MGGICSVRASKSIAKIPIPTVGDTACGVGAVVEDDCVAARRGSEVEIGNIILVYVYDTNGGIGTKRIHI